jgi:type I restriction-modification system DNA methylase subunit
MLNNFSDFSRNITAELSKEVKKDNGIFFTPYSIIDKNMEVLKPYMKDVKTVLEPGCGTGQYIERISKSYKVHITGLELNEKIYKTAKKQKFKNTRILNRDFLKYNSRKKFDLIVGNPPFYVLKKNEVSSRYYYYFDGRPNIFVIFIMKALRLLNKNGILSFVLPKNFINCIYYDKVREYIKDYCTIIDIIDCSEDNYLDTKQDTIVFVLQNKEGDNSSYTLNLPKFTIFNTKQNIQVLNKLYEGSTDLNELNFKVSVGTIVWNQHKDILTDDDTKTRLIYSSDIVDKKLTIKEYKNDKKKNYIDKLGRKGPMLVINRGYGVGNYNFNYCLIDVKYSYLIENHLVCIKYKDKITTTKLRKLYKKIVKSLQNEKTKQFIKIYFGNNAINTTELNYILPIYN